MARPRKKVVEENLDFESRIEKETKTQDKIKSEKVESFRKEEDERKRERLARKEKIRQLRDKFKKNNTEIQIMCNLTNCSYIYKDPKSGNEYKMDKFGQTDFITFNDLYTMARLNRTHLEKYWIVIIEVLDDEATIQDLIEVLQIEDIYTNEEMMYEDNLDYILKETDLNEFTHIVDNINENYKQAIMNRAIGLYNASKFNDISRLRILIKDEDELADMLEL